MEEISTTQRLFLEIGKREFSAHGFKGASLRKIVSEAGFTLGAFYGYYRSKEELFDAIVAETAEYITGYIRSIYADVRRYPSEERIWHITECFSDRLPQAIDFLLTHDEELKLILLKSEGTRYADFAGTMAGISSENLGTETLWITKDDRVFQILMQAYYSMLIQIILSGGDKETILQTMTDIQSFYQAGFQYFMKKRGQ